MIYPSIDEITKGQYNRYTLCIATAKCARIVTDEYVEQRELAEKMLANKETDKSLASMIKREILPAASREEDRLASVILHKKSAIKNLSCKAEEALLQELSELIGRASCRERV